MAESMGILEKNKMLVSDLDWQTTKKNLREKFAFLYLNSVMADISFNVGSEDTGRIPAHSFVLKIGSPVFNAMFNSDFIESESQDKKIDVPDMEPKVFKSLLMYLYVNEVLFDGANVIPLMYASKKYMLPILTNRCITFLFSIVKASNAIYLMSKTRIYDCPNFWKKCWDVILEDPKSSLGAESFVNVDFNTLLDVLINKNFERSEIDAFNAVLKWATARLESKEINEKYDGGEEERIKALGLKKRQVLGSAFHHIRFHKMTNLEIFDVVVPSGLLSANETANVIASINSHNIK